MKHSLTMFLRILHTGVINFMRNITLAIAAIAVMVVTLTIVLFSVISNSTFINTIAQITDKIDVSVYLKDDVTQDQTSKLVKGIAVLPNVKKVSYLSKDQVLKKYMAQNVGNVQLQAAINSTNNPLPATILIKPIDLNKIKDIKTYLIKTDIAALQSDPPSYSGDRKAAIDKITHITNVLKEIGIFAVVLFAVICALIIFNTIQMAIFNRRDEIQIMRLLGASKSYIRGPFIVESAIYGLLSAIISILIVNSTFLASTTALQASSLGLLDINYANTWFGSHFWSLLGMQVLLGILLGTTSSLIATRRYLKFKTK